MDKGVGLVIDFLPSLTPYIRALTPYIVTVTPYIRMKYLIPNGMS